jgi:hypothetical protein
MGLFHYEILTEALWYKPEGLSNRHSPFSRSMALVSTQSVTEMSTKNLHGSKGLPAICEPLVLRNVGASMSHNLVGYHVSRVGSSFHRALFCL